MEIIFTRVLEALLLPPGSLLLLFIAGLAFMQRANSALASHAASECATTPQRNNPVLAPVLRSQRLAVMCLLTALGGLTIFSLPVTARSLLAVLESYPALTAETLRAQPAQAIVVLGAGRYAHAPEYDNADTASQIALTRLRYAAHLSRLTGLPILASGGDPFNEGRAEAALMQQVLTDDFRISPVWVEDQSRTTAENALYSRLILEKRGIKQVYLVTSAWHMPRAAQMFRQVGINIIPAPTYFLSLPAPDSSGLLGWLPSAAAMGRCQLALHEMLGILWYMLRY